MARMAVVEEPASDRVRLRRGAQHGVYDRDAIFEILDAAVIAHVGVTTEKGPIVIPMAFGRTDEWLYVHGAVANGALRAAVGQDICITVTLVDGLIFGRSPFHNSMQYRSVVVRGTARKVTDPAEHVLALQLVSDHVAKNWDHGRPPDDIEVRKTMVIAVALEEMSAKTRAGGPGDEPEDLDGPHWGGSVPLISSWGDPVPSPDLPDGIEPPPSVAALAGARIDVHGTDDRERPVASAPGALRRHPPGAPA